MIENFIVHCRSQLTRREWTGRDRDIMWKKHTKFLWQWNSQTYLHLIISTGFCDMQCFFKDQQKKDGRDFEPDTVSSFQKNQAN